MPTPCRRSPGRTAALIVALLTGALCACRAPNPDPTVGADVTAPDDPLHDTFDDTSAGASPPGVTLTTDSPTDLGVQILDEMGAPVEGASVTVDGRSAVTDAEGNARISGLAPSSEARVVHIARDGYATLVRRIEADASGSLGLSGALTTLQDLGWFDATADNALDLDDFSITLDAHSLVDASGEVYTGQIHAQYATWATHGESDPSLARSPGPLLAEDETNAGELDALESFGMFQIELSDDAGLPLFLGEGQRAGVSLTVPGEGDTGDDLDPSEAAWWSLDEQAGLWVPVCGDGEPEDGAECTSEAVEGGVRLSALVPHFSKYNVDLRRTRGCASVSADLDASLLPGAVFGISGPGYDLRLPAGDGTLDLVAMPRGAMSATLYLYDRAVATGTVKPAELGDGACSASLTLRPSPDRRGSATGGGGMVVRARSGTCPASGGTVRVSRGGSTVLTGSMADAMTWIDDLPEGTYSVSLVNTLGQVQDSAELTLSAGVEAPALVTLEAPASWAKVPPGGCVDLPCEGDACDSCAQMEVTEGGVPVAELAVSLDSDSEPTFTDDEGQVCRDLEGLADQRLLVSLPDGTLGSGTLPRSGSCEAGGCLAIPLEVGAGRSCPAGTEAWSASSAWLGALNPGFLDDRTVVPPTPIEGGGL